MAKLITRYFESTAQARAAVKELTEIQRVSRRIMYLVEGTDGAETAFADAGVADATAREYLNRLSHGGAVLMVAAGFKPLGVARTTREVTAAMGATLLDGVTEEVEIEDSKDYSLNLLREHPLLLTRLRDPDSTTFHMANWPIPLISRRKPFTGSIVPPHGRMARFPFGLISKRKPFTGSIFSRHARMANFPISLLSKRKPYDEFAFPRHARMANFPIPLLSDRKPYTGSIIARHARMANWPFPHLINGKIGTNSLMPGAPRMANFPIPLLSDRKPADSFAFPRHARMANFPIPLLSDRKPYTGSAIKPHARMADMILPLIMTRTARDRRASRNGFSLPGFFGLPTLVRR